MRTKSDCGPAAIAAASGLPYEQVMAAWPSKFRGNLQDSPLHHKATLRNLGLRQRVVTCGDILAGRCPAGLTIVLLHSLDNPATPLPEDLLQQHWVVVARVDPAVPSQAQARVFVHWGDGTLKAFAAEAFQVVYAGGPVSGPACAYVIGEGEVPRMTLAERLYLWLSRWG